jgi:hypothetical protein
MLKHNWVNKNKKYAFSGISKIYEHYKGAIPIGKIKNELSEIQSYTRHKEGRKNKNFNPFYVHSAHEMWQADIMYLPDYKTESLGFKYLLCVIDVFSRKLYIRKLRKKDTATVVKNFDSIHTEVCATPSKIVVDKGSEFKSSTFQRYCDAHKVKLVFTYNDTKAAHVERAQRSFQNILYKVLEEHQTRDFIKFLPDVLRIYNNRKNRITGFSPNDAIQEKNYKAVSKNLEKYYDSKNKKSKKPQYKIGDFVRIREKRQTFARGYHPYFTEEIFKISQVLTNLAFPRYVITNYAGDEEIKGTFYESELTLTNLETFKVEKIIKKRKVKGKTEYLIKWLGYPSSQNSWVDSSWLQEIK